MPPRAVQARSNVQIDETDHLYSANLLRQLMEVSQALNRRLLDKLSARGHGNLSMSFATVMAHAGFSGTRLSDIAMTNGMSKQAVSQTAGELAALGYVRLQPACDDARAREIVLTKAGEALIADSLRLMESVRSEAASIVGAERFGEFEAVISELWVKLGRRASRTEHIDA